MKKLTPYNLIIFIILVSFTVNAQININDKDIVLPAKPIEQISIQTDRNLYLSGENIWFKAHCINEDSISYHISKILYLEIFNHSKDVSIKHKFKIRNGISHGAIELPENIPSGMYFLRAYTHLLRNYPPETYPSMAVGIINPLNELSANASKTESKNFEYVTEYGNLTDGINSNVALRFHNNFHLLVNESSIVDHENNTISQINLVKNNLGIFNFTPLSSTSYFIKLITKNNDTIMEALPEVKQKGIAIKQLPSESGKINFNIIKNSITTNLSSEAQYSVEIITGFKRLIYKSVINLTDGENDFSIAKDELETGINLMVLKDGLGNVISNYPFIFHASKNLKLNLSIQQQQFKQREKVDLDILLPSVNPDNIVNLSVAVVKKGSRDDFSLPILDNHQLLTSYCKSLKSETLSKDQIDILRMFYRKMVLEPNYQNESYAKTVSFKWLPETREVSISGVISHKETKQPVAKTPIYLTVLKNNPQLHINRSQDKGEFIFSLNKLEGNQNVFLCPIYMAEDNLEIKINADFSNSYPTTKAIPLPLNQNDRLLLKEMLINQQSNILFNITKPDKQAPVYHHNMNIINPPTSVLLEDFIDLNSMETVFREIIPNCLVRKRDNEFTIHVADRLSAYSSDKPLILVDNLPVFDVNEIFKIHPSKIKKIEINPNDLILGDNILKGLIRLTTNTDNFGGITLPEGSTFIEYQTISPSYLFKSPTYETSALKSDRSADFRTTLYWNPAMEIKGKSQINFYTSDHCSEYDVIVSGMGQDGRKYYGRASFEVVKNQ